MDEHERGYCEGYQQALKTVNDMFNDGMSPAMIKEAVAEELNTEDQY